MVSCNDCYAKSAVKYHWLGLKCAICDSYNTVQLSILSDPAVEVPVIESREVEAAVPEPGVGEASTSSHLAPAAGPVRHRRHSSHAPTPSTLSPRFSPYPVPQRIGRSVSPARGLGFFEDAIVIDAPETEESGNEEDDLDFWGRDEPRSVTSAENMEVDMEEEEEDSDEDSGSAMDECDEEADEGDDFELFGHR